MQHTYVSFVVGRHGSLNPVIVIPSYWAKNDAPTSVGDVGIYDQVTPISKPLPELETCLQSLEQVRGVLRVIVLVVAPPSCTDAARARVDGICRAHRNLNPLVIGAPEAKAVKRVVEQVMPGMDREPISLRGYGAIHNMGLAVAAALGHDVVVFLDDDDVAIDENFLIDAAYGIGLQTRQGLPIVAKSGYFLDVAGSPYADRSRPRWYDRFWSKSESFNLWMHHMLEGTRICRSNYVCGGCFCVAAEAFSNVPYDPQITRGEDLDYLINLRMYGYDVWFDNKWRVRHMPPKAPSYAARFLQDVYRWTYEVTKLEASHRIIGLRHVTAESLEPYPGNWVSRRDVSKKISRTSLLRAIGCDEHAAYLQIFFHGKHQAQEWATSVSRSYFSLQTYWPRIMASLWDDKALAHRLTVMGTPKVVTVVPKAHKLGSLDDSLPMLEDAN